MLIGHAAAQSQLATLLAEGRFPHALLIHGPRGIGKRLLAEQVAYRLICGKPEADGDMLGDAKPAAPLAWNTESPQAAQLAAGSCPDYYVLSPEDLKKSTSIKQVRALLESLQRSADTARVVIIDALEDLTMEASNTLLKTLEEPRPGIYFMLVCHQLGAILPTIISRCRLLRVTPLSRTETEQVLTANKSDAVLAHLANGAPGSVSGKAGQLRYQLLQDLKSGQAPAGNTENLISALQQHLAGKRPSLTGANTYQQLAKLKALQEEINLPTNLANQAALAKLNDHR